MDTLKWILTNFDRSWLLVALVFQTATIGSLVIGYPRADPKPKGEAERSFQWWVGKQGKELERNEVIDSFNALVRDPIKDRVRFLVKSKTGDMFEGTLDSMSSGGSVGYYYGFRTREGGSKHLPLKDLESVTVVVVRE